MAEESAATAVAAAAEELPTLEEAAVTLLSLQKEETPKKAEEEEEEKKKKKSPYDPATIKRPHGMSDASVHAIVMRYHADDPGSVTAIIDPNLKTATAKEDEFDEVTRAHAANPMATQFRAEIVGYCTKMKWPSQCTHVAFEPRLETAFKQSGWTPPFLEYYRIDLECGPHAIIPEAALAIYQKCGTSPQALVRVVQHLRSPLRSAPTHTDICLKPNIAVDTDIPVFETRLETLEPAVIAAVCLKMDDDYPTSIILGVMGTVVKCLAHHLRRWYIAHEKSPGRVIEWFHGSTTGRKSDRVFYLRFGHRELIREGRSEERLRAPRITPLNAENASNGQQQQRAKLADLAKTASGDEETQEEEEEEERKKEEKVNKEKESTTLPYTDAAGLEDEEEEEKVEE